MGLYEYAMVMVVVTIACCKLIWVYLLYLFTRRSRILHNDVHNAKHVNTCMTDCFTYLLLRGPWSFPVSFSNLRTKNEFVFRFSFSKVK